MKPECSVVVPVYNEEQVLPTMHLRLTATLCRLAIPYEVIYVDDGSSDRTAEIILEFCERDANIKAVLLSRNFGHQAALCAGLEAATGRAVISIDGDLQDPPELIPALIDKWHDGFDVVYARRRRRREHFLKRTACFVFYRLLRKYSEIPIPLDTGDFALMDQQALQYLNNLPERTRFVRGLRSWVGFRQGEVEYDRDIRHDGESKYPFSRLLRLALDGFVSFTDAPLRAITLTGLLLVMAGIIGALTGIGGWLGNAGWAMSKTTLLLGSGLTVLGGLQLLAMGVIGEYVSRIYRESRARPLYVARSKVGFQSHPRPVPQILDFLTTDEHAAHQEVATATSVGADWEPEY